MSWMISLLIWSNPCSCKSNTLGKTKGRTAMCRNSPNNSFSENPQSMASTETKWKTSSTRPKSRWSAQISSVTSSKGQERCQTSRPWISIPKAPTPQTSSQSSSTNRRTRSNSRPQTRIWTLMKKIQAKSNVTSVLKLPNQNSISY